jgi:hypothetical protein
MGIMSWFGEPKYKDSDKVSEIEALMTQGGYNFEGVIEMLEMLSPKAQATFAYLYVQSVSKNSRLLGTLKRYLDMKSSGVVIPQRTKGKGL